MAYRIPQEDREDNLEFHGAVDRAIEQIEHKRYFHRQVEVAKYLGEVFCISVTPVHL
jgi:hypothetical protein